METLSSQQCVMSGWASLGEWVYNGLNSPGNPQDSRQHRCIRIRMLMKPVFCLALVLAVVPAFAQQPQSQTQSANAGSAAKPAACEAAFAGPTLGRTASKKPLWRRSLHG